MRDRAHERPAASGRVFAAGRRGKSALHTHEPRDVDRVAGDARQRRRPAGPELPDPTVPRRPRLVHGHRIRERPSRDELPTGPVSGVWVCNIKLAKGSGGSNPTRVFVSLDPHFHANPVDHGQGLLDRPSTYQGSISIDTRTLPDGVHPLFLRTDSSIAMGTGSGALVVQFTVDNGGVLAAAIKVGNDILDPTGPGMPTIVLLFVFAINLPWTAIRRTMRARRPAAGREV